MSEVTGEGTPELYLVVGAPHDPALAYTLRKPQEGYDELSPRLFVMDNAKRDHMTSFRRWFNLQRRHRKPDPLDYQTGNPLGFRSVRRGRPNFPAGLHA